MPRSCTNLRTSLENLNNSVLACEIINKNINIITVGIKAGKAVGTATGTVLLYVRPPTEIGGNKN